MELAGKVRPTYWHPIALARATFLEEDLLAEVGDRGADFRLLLGRCAACLGTLAARTGCHEARGRYFLPVAAVRGMLQGCVEVTRREELVGRRKTVVRVIEQIDHARVCCMRADRVEHNLGLVLLAGARHREGM